MATRLPNTYSAQLTVQIPDIKIMAFWVTFMFLSNIMPINLNIDAGVSVSHTYVVTQTDFLLSHMTQQE